MLARERAEIGQIMQNLSVTEKFVVHHRDARLTAEIAWHESLLEKIPDILSEAQKCQKKNRQ